MISTSRDLETVFNLGIERAASPYGVLVHLVDPKYPTRTLCGACVAPLTPPQADCCAVCRTAASRLILRVYGNQDPRS